MKNLFPVAAAVVGLTVSSIAFAATTTATAPATAKPAPAVHESAAKAKHGACLKEAHEQKLKGKAEHKFMKECMSAKSESGEAAKK